MSVRIPLDKVTMVERTNITKKLRFNKKETEYNKFKPAATVWAYDIEGDQATDDDEQKGTIFVPFWWGLRNIKQAERPKREVFQPMSVKFTGALRPLQLEVKTEALGLLNRNGSCILSLYTGAGKTITSISPFLTSFVNR